MTVKELIEYLETLPSETVVKVPEVMENGYGGYTRLQDPIIEGNMFFYESISGEDCELEIGETV